MAKARGAKNNMLKRMCELEINVPEMTSLVRYIG